MNAHIRLIAAIALFLLAFACHEATAAARPSYSTGYAVLEVGGVPLAYVSSFEHASRLQSERSGYEGATNFAHDSQAPEEFSVVLSQSLDNRLFGILGRQISRGGERLNGRLLSLDWEGNVRRVFEFSDAIVNEVRFSTLDATSRERFTLGLKLSAGQTRWSKGGGKANYRDIKAGDRRNVWLAANFRLDIAGLDSRAVMRIESFSLVRKGNPGLGNGPQYRDYEDGETGFEMPKLTLGLSDYFGTEVFDWYEELHADTADAEAAERSGTLTLLAADQTTPLFGIALTHLGVYRIAHAKEPRADESGKISAGFYVEGLSFVTGKP
ncbi:hypothetical protein [Methylococcus sp. EFPC2]|uniref:hypothetical protein n=1 Tax=Methylococcus sp. EFPC2 TaxID=2812648 RepID=UPI0019681039|nr:hypothetical protein [Methylococcus sp. EFPC2]QSA97921.1 hypothetical protein JWZ97_03575 [Methylococcus sp. EFPC2]